MSLAAEALTYQRAVLDFARSLSWVPSHAHLCDCHGLTLTLPRPFALSAIKMDVAFLGSRAKRTFYNS